MIPREQLRSNQRIGTFHCFFHSSLSRQISQLTSPGKISLCLVKSICGSLLNSSTSLMNPRQWRAAVLWKSCCIESHEYMLESDFDFLDGNFPSPFEHQHCRFHGTVLFLLLFRGGGGGEEEWTDVQVKGKLDGSTGLSSNQEYQQTSISISIQINQS